MISLRTIMLVQIAAFIGFTTTGAFAQLPVSGRPVPMLSSFDDAMQSYMNFNGIQAGVLAVSVNGNVVYQRGFGTDVPENTPMRIASVEKPITAAAIQHLIANGQLDLNDFAFDLGQPGGGILPHTPWDGLGDPLLPTITIMDLLNHQGGWDRGTAAIGDPQFETLEIAQEMGIAPPAGPDDIIRYMLSEPLDFMPGSNGCADDDGNPTFCYSNFGYMVLGKIVEEISGLSLHAYVRAYILTPGMGVPHQEIVFGRSFVAEQDPREPVYQCTFCSVTNVFDPDGPDVERPYGGWHQEAFIGHGNYVASAMPLLAFMDRYQVGVQNGAGVPLPPGSFGGGTFNGALEGTSTTILQRGDGINIVVLFTERNNTDHANLVANMISNLIDGSISTWPTATSDGFWTDFGATNAGPQVGGYHHPFRTIWQAIDVGPGAKVRLKPGSTSWTGTISHLMHFDAPLGESTIGQ